MSDRNLSKQKQSWVVTASVTVTKIIVCEGCTEDEARRDPFAHSVDEREVDMSDWDVKKVEANV